MGDVIRIAQFQNSDAVALLRALTIAAINGDVIGIRAEVRMRDGRACTCTCGTCTPPPPALAPAKSK